MDELAARKLRDAQPSRLVFSDRELLLDSGELRGGGSVCRLQPQPARLLALIARRAGEVVSREELRREIWGDDAFIDVDQGINYCVRQIRRALGDSPKTPRFVETIPRRGYRFLVPASIEGRDGAAPPRVAAARTWLLLPTGIAFSLLWLVLRRPAGRATRDRS